MGGRFAVRHVGVRGRRKKCEKFNAICSSGVTATTVADAEKRKRIIKNPFSEGSAERL